MRDRVISISGKEGRAVWISTFHSACVRILRQHIERLGVNRHFTIADASDSKKIIKDILASMNIDARVLTPRRAAYLISNAKSALVGPDRMDELGEVKRDHLLKKLIQIYAAYEERLRKSQSLDFDDLLFFTFRLFEEHPDVLGNYSDLLHYIMVDEYQDTNHAQYQIIKQLSAKRRNLCVVGDDDQSIYRWRGADITNILSFEKDFPEAKVVPLMENYRSTGHILKAASCLISNNTGRKEKDLVAVRPDGQKVSAYAAFDERDEGDFIAGCILDLTRREGLFYRDFAAFYRINAQSRAIEDSLRRMNIPYVIVGGVRFYDRREIRDVIAYLRLILNPSDWTSFERVVNSPGRGVGKVTLAKVRKAGESDAEIKPEVAAFTAVTEGKISGKAAGSLKKFCEAMAGLRDKLDIISLDEFVVLTLEETGYLPALQDENTEDARGRIENLHEFLTVVDDFLETGSVEPGSTGTDVLGAFLDQISLVADVDSWEDKDSTVTLMTLHSAKGLEFPVVFMPGVEEELLPHYRAQGEPAEMEEERRLCYVGMTRAKERLFLTMARRRRLFGQYDNALPSRFFTELPRENVEMHVESGFPLPGIAPTQSALATPGLNDETVPIGEFHYVPEPVEGEDTLLPGMDVLHPMFGAGQVMGVEGTGGDARITVYFPRGGKKKLIAKYANLRIAE